MDRLLNLPSGKARPQEAELTTALKQTELQLAHYKNKVRLDECIAKRKKPVQDPSLQLIYADMYADMRALASKCQDHENQRFRSRINDLEAAHNVVQEERDNARKEKRELAAALATALRNCDLKTNEISQAANLHASDLEQIEVQAQAESMLRDQVEALQARFEKAETEAKKLSQVRTRFNDLEILSEVTTKSSQVTRESNDLEAGVHREFRAPSNPQTLTEYEREFEQVLETMTGIEKNRVTVMEAMKKALDDRDEHIGFLHHDIATELEKVLTEVSEVYKRALHLIDTQRDRSALLERAA